MLLNGAVSRLQVCTNICLASITGTACSCTGSQLHLKCACCANNIDALHTTLMHCTPMTNQFVCSLPM